MDSLIPSGVYRGRLLGAEHYDSPASGRWFMKFDFELVDPPYEGRKMTYRVAPAPMTMNWVDHLATVFDMPTRGAFIREIYTLGGDIVMLRVTQRDFHDMRLNIIERIDACQQ